MDKYELMKRLDSAIEKSHHHISNDKRVAYAEGYLDALRLTGVIDIYEQLEQAIAIEKYMLDSDHFLIIGQHIGEPIGCCSFAGMGDVLVEEPGSTFIQIPKEECRICNDDE